MPQAQTYQSEFTGLEMDARFAAVAQLTAALEALTTVVAQKYVKPASGIPSTDMDADVQAALAKANTAVQSLADYYTKNEVDQLLAAINGMEYVDVAALPTASAETLGKIYLVGPDGSGYYAYYYTSYDGSAYSWVGPLGTTEISLANYATKAELSQLDQKVDEMYVPKGYHRLEWIGSDSTAFIDTGIAGRRGLTIRARLFYDKHVNYGAFYGNYTVDSAKGYRAIVGASDGNLVVAVSSSFTATGVNNAVTKGAWFDLVAESNGNIYINGSLIQTVSPASDGVTDKICLFNRSLTSQPSTPRNIGARCQKFIIEENGIAVLNLAPMKRDVDGVVGMYDFVSKTFLTNIGASTFTHGEILPLISDLQNDIERISPKVDATIQMTETPTVNLFDKTAALEGMYINKTTGAVAPNSPNSATDFIPIDSRGLYFNAGMTGGTAIGCAVYNANKQYKRADGPNGVIYQDGDAFVRFSLLTTNIDTAMCVAGTLADVPAEYVPYGTIKDYFLKDEVVPFNALSFKATQAGKNKLNKTEILDEKYINKNTGAVETYSVTAATPFIPASPRGLFFNKYFLGGAAIGAAVYDEQKRYLREATNPYIYQDGDAFVRYSMLIGDKNVAQVEEGSVATDYEEYTEREVIDATYLPDSPSEGAGKENTIDVILPSKLYAVVGDTLQIFFKQCVQAVSPLDYNILVACAKGRQYHRYFEYTPTAEDVGETALSIYVKNDMGEIVGNGSCTLVTIAVPSSPVTVKNILCIGDSLTANGKWPAEAYRRLAGNGGSPAGDALSNISFVGSMIKDGAGYLGNSGWAWRDYCTQGRPAFRFTVGTGITANIGAVYSNNSHNYTVIEVSDDGTILCSAASSSDTPETSGTLTKVSGGGDATISYSAYVAASQNPFWDGTKLTFVPYVNNYCGGNIDEVFVLLGGNGLANWKMDFSEEVGYIEDFADTLHAEYPSAKLVLMGMQFPSMELMMPSYGASGSLYADTYGILVSIARLREIYKEFAERDEYKDFVSAIDVGCQFDGDYNYPVTEKAVNTRMLSKTEPYDNNALHPGDAGYMQYADAVYRALCAELSL